MSRWVDPEHAYNPKIVFAVRMKMIIVLVENDDSKRADFILDEITPKIVQKHSRDFLQFISMPNIMEVIVSCSQMLPHMIFFNQETEKAAPYYIVKNLSQDFFDCLSAIMSWKIEYFITLKPYYESAKSFDVSLQSKKNEVAAIEAEKQDVLNFMNNLATNQELPGVFNRIINAIVAELIISHTILSEADKSAEEAA